MPSHLLEHVPPLLLNLSPLTYLILSPQRHLLRLYSFFDGPACFATFQTIECAELLQTLNSAQMCQQNKKLLKVRATTFDVGRSNAVAATHLLLWTRVRATPNSSRAG